MPSGAYFFSVRAKNAGGEHCDRLREKVSSSERKEKSDEPHGLSLSGCRLSGTPADVPQPGGRCAGPALLHVWTGHRAAGRTAASGKASDGGRDPSGTAGAAGTAGGDDGAARNPLPV